MKNVLLLAFNGISVIILLSASSMTRTQRAASCNSMQQAYAAGKLSAYDAQYYQKYCLTV